MKNKTISKRYAASFIASIAKKNIDENFEDFSTFASVYLEDKQLQYILKHPEIALHKKVDLINKLFGKTGMKEACNFVCLLVKRQRISLLKIVKEEVTRLYRKSKGIRDIKVKCAVKMTEAEWLKLKNILEQKFGQIEITEEIDPSLIGGIIICFEDQVLDESIRFRLKRLKELMIRIDNEWLATLIEQPGLAI